jgi:hypothetical protein
VALVEFQPSSWSRGSYLNVGVQWLWDVQQDVLGAFMYSGGCHGDPRVIPPDLGQFVPQFAPLARRLAEAAADRVISLRRLLPSVSAAAGRLLRCDRPDFDVDAGIAADAFRAAIADAARTVRTAARLDPEVGSAL